MKLIKQDSTEQTKKKQTNKQTKTKQNKKENKMKLHAPSPPPFHFEWSINQSYDQ